MSTSLSRHAPKTHPLSTDFRWQDNGVKRPQRLTRAQLAAFNTDGFVLLPAVFSPEEVEKVISEIDPLEAKGEAWLREKGGDFKFAECAPKRDNRSRGATQ